MEEEEELLLMGRPKAIPFSVFGNDVNNIPEPSPLILIDGLIYRKIGGEMVLISGIVTIDGQQLTDNGKIIFYEVQNA